MFYQMTMRKLFFDLLTERMRKNKDIYVIFCGLGYPRYEGFKNEFPGRVINTEASEQASMDIACGLALSGKIPFIYSITPFLLWRAAETIRTYINHEKLNVKLIGAGRGDDYTKHDGFSHDACDDYDLLEYMTNINCEWPQEEGDIEELLDEMIKSKEPYYLNLRR